MKFGLLIIRFFREHSKDIVNIEIDGHPTEGSLKLQLKSGQVKIFDKWDEEDQGLFACAMNGEQWDSSKRGIPASLTIKTKSEKLEIKTDKPVQHVLNGKKVSEPSSHSFFAAKKQTSCAETTIFDQFINDITSYVTKYPKTKPFLIAFKSKNYELAMRYACAAGNNFLLNLLLNYSHKTGIALDLDSASTDGKTAFHHAATHSNKTNGLSCIKKLLDYACQDISKGFNFDKKDGADKSFKDYLVAENQNEIDEYLLSKYEQITSTFK